MTAKYKIEQDLTQADPILLRSQLQEKGVKYALASYVDLHGMCKAKMVPLSHFEQMVKGSELFTGAALDGVPQSINDEEVAAHPDLNSAIVLPWNREVAWFASDLYCQNEPFAACSRNILKRVLDRANGMGYTFNLGIETEFFILKDTQDGKFTPASDRDTLAKAAYDVPTLLDNYQVINELVTAMNELGWDVYSFDHEDARGQFEIDFNYSDGLTMADRFTFFRLMAKEIAKKYGCFASFMPKLSSELTGSGAHYNMSLADKDTGYNLFIDLKDTRGCKLSKLGYQFIAGILEHAGAICAVTCPTVNSYKRLVRQGAMSGSTWAPVYICYGNNNRTNMLRIPLAGGRVECRAADISTNLYLGAAMILAAGLEGIKEGLDPGEPHTENMYEYRLAELQAKGIKSLPQTLGEAVAAFAADPLSEKVMGKAMYHSFIDYKQQEWSEYHAHVSDWEIRRYLKFF